MVEVEPDFVATKDTDYISVSRRECHAIYLGKVIFPCGRLLLGWDGGDQFRQGYEEDSRRLSVEWKTSTCDARRVVEKAKPCRIAQPPGHFLPCTISSSSISVSNTNDHKVAEHGNYQKLTKQKR